ncbi:MAG: LysE family translocator [Actinomycetaceae bacterium]|nr:LysE family translocator [Actinomycetaceae bacterium]
MTLSSWMTLIAVWAAGLVSPGPDVFAVIQQARHQRARQTALGVVTGIALWIIATMAGVGALATHAPGVFAVLRWVGVGFLAVYGTWIVTHVLRSSATRASATDSSENSEKTDEKETPAVRARGFVLGLATNAFNPKALVFFIALFASLVPTPMPVILGLAIVSLMVAMALAWFLTLASLASWPPLNRLLRRYSRTVDLVVGCVLIFFAIILAIEALG